MLCNKERSQAVYDQKYSPMIGFHTRVNILCCTLEKFAVEYRKKIVYCMRYE